MDPLHFHTSLEAIKALNASEGPAHNIFIPKFEARKQAEQLRDTLFNVYRDAASTQALQQLCRCLVFIGTTMMEVEEEEEGYTEVRRAYQVLRWCATAELPASEAVREVAAVPQDDILGSIASSPDLVTESTGYAGCVEFMAVYNAMGLYLSKVDLSQAKTVLSRAEALYVAWNAWWLQQPTHCTIDDIPLNTDGTLRVADMPSEKVQPLLLRYYMDTHYTSTLFFVAQLYTAEHNATAASQYCHRTMYYQLLNRQEFDAKSWASNALQLSGFYSSHFAYDEAYHCLLAGQTVMPASEEPEEARGLVAWAFGRFYLHRLHHYAGLLTGSEPAADHDDVAQLKASWLSFPGMPPLQPFATITTFDEARDCFKEGIKWLQEAQECRPFETSCTEHIDIARDMVQLYAALQVFEPSRARRIAMMQRQIHLLEPFPDQLNFNAYPVVVRQLLYDLGGLYEDQMRLRVQQRKQPLQDDKPLKNRAFNALVTTTLDYYNCFIETWRHPSTHQIPEVLEEESRLPFFRALMRLAQVQLSYAYNTAKEEYDGIGVACKAYTRVLDFYDKNPLPAEVNAQVSKEVELAREMLKLLPVKQRDLWIAFQRNSV
ncbi:KIF-1 binding protein C terminal [Lotmaria passim]